MGPHPARLKKMEKRLKQETYKEQPLSQESGSTEQGNRHEMFGFDLSEWEKEKQVRLA